MTGIIVFWTTYSKTGYDKDHFEIFDIDELHEAEEVYERKKKLKTTTSVGIGNITNFEFKQYD